MNVQLLDTDCPKNVLENHVKENLRNTGQMSVDLQRLTDQGYTFKVFGGNHSTLGALDAHNLTGNDVYLYRDAIIFCQMPDSVRRAVASKDNRRLNYTASYTELAILIINEMEVSSQQCTFKRIYSP